MLKEIRVFWDVMPCQLAPGAECLHVKGSSSPVKLFILLQRLKFFLCLIKHHAMEVYGGMGIHLHTFLTLALGGCEWSDSCCGDFMLGYQPSTRCINGYMCSRVVQSVVQMLLLLHSVLLHSPSPLHSHYTAVTALLQ